jgi:hypothetical protein
MHDYVGMVNRQIRVLRHRTRRRNRIAAQEQLRLDTGKRPQLDDDTRDLRSRVLLRDAFYLLKQRDTD